MELDDLVTTLLESIADRRLVVLAGAGLSFASPSNAPSAANTAASAVATHERLTGQELPPALNWNLAQLASFFYGRGTLPTYFLNRLVDWTRFRAEASLGHFAIADFLACGAIDFAVTTNFDTLVELAAAQIGEPDFQSALDGEEANRATEHHPYLKVYGCCERDRANTVWCVEQTKASPLRERLDYSKAWLSGRLLNRDLLLIGFWSDWDYLNEILESALPPVSTSRIFVVDPATLQTLEAKAGRLWAWAKSHPRFEHVQATANDALHAIRAKFSMLLLQRILSLGGPHVPATALGTLPVDDAYAIRRDLAGVDAVARDRDAAPEMQAFAIAHSELISRGVPFDNGRYVMAGQRVRVVQSAGRLLSEVRAAVSAAPRLSADLDAFVCAGATDDGDASPNIVRGDADATIIRGGTKNLEFFTSVAPLLQPEA